MTARLPPRGALAALAPLALLLAGCAEPALADRYAFAPPHREGGEESVRSPFEVAFARIDVAPAEGLVAVWGNVTAVWGDAAGVRVSFEGCPAEGDRCESPGGVAWEPASLAWASLPRDQPEPFQALARLAGQGTFLLEVRVRGSMDHGAQGGPEDVGGYRRCFVVLRPGAPPEVYVDTPPGDPGGRAMAVPAEPAGA